MCSVGVCFECSACKTGLIYLQMDVLTNKEYRHYFENLINRTICNNPSLHLFPDAIAWVGAGARDTNMVVVVCLVRKSVRADSGWHIRHAAHAVHARPLLH